MYHAFFNNIEGSVEFVHGLETAKIVGLGMQNQTNFIMKPT